MPIEFACPKCEKKYSVKEEFAGKSAKCGKCNHRMKVPEPAVVPDAGIDLGNWLDEELEADPSVPTPQQPTSKKLCDSCGKSMAADAVLCVACGYDTVSGKKLKREKTKSKSAAKAAAVVGKTATILRGTIFSAIGAGIGAAVWYGVVVAIGYEVGWIAWGLGLAAGAGMAIGHEDDDGTMAGVMAAGMAILGILAAKFAVLQHISSKLAEVGLSLEAAGTLVGEPITFGSLFGPIDGLFILLAVASAYKIGSGQMTD